MRPDMPMSLQKTLGLTFIVIVLSLTGYTLSNLNQLRNTTPNYDSTKTEPSTVLLSSELESANSDTSEQNSEASVTENQPEAEPTSTLSLLDYDTNTVDGMQQWLRELRQTHRYDQYGARYISKTNEHGLTESAYEVKKPMVLERIIELARINPEIFLELMQENAFDSYLVVALDTVVSESNVHLLTDYMSLENPSFSLIAIDNGLHLQNPNAFTQVYEDALADNYRLYQPSILQSMLEVDPFRYKEIIIEKAINSRWPKIYFDTLAMQTDENLVMLAQKMWAKHQRDDYAEEPTSDDTTGYDERQRVAFRYGVKQAINYINLALEDDYDLDTPALIESVVEVDNAVAKFSRIKDDIEFDETRLRWVLP
jgi:hypothetical protein